MCAPSPSCLPRLLGGVTAGSSLARSAGVDRWLHGRRALRRRRRRRSTPHRSSPRQGSDRTPASPDRPASPPAIRWRMVGPRTSGGVSSSGGTTKPVATRPRRPSDRASSTNAVTNCSCVPRFGDLDEVFDQGQLLAAARQRCGRVPSVMHRALDRVQLLEHRAVAADLGCSLVNPRRSRPTWRVATVPRRDAADPAATRPRRGSSVPARALRVRRTTCGRGRSRRPSRARCRPRAAGRARERGRCRR